MALNTRSVFDPRFARAFAGVGRGAMSTKIEVFRRGDSPIGEWDYALGAYKPNGILPRFISMARVQPNMDWRARSYVISDDATAFQTVAFEVPNTTASWADDAPEDQREFWNPEISFDKRIHEVGDRIRITQTHFQELSPLLQYVFVVRNPLRSDKSGLGGLLCDVDMKSALAK